MEKRKPWLPEEETRALLAQVMHQTLVRQALTEAGNWTVRPGFARSLDIAFVPRRTKGDEFLGVHLFGSSNCIGIKLAKDGGHAAAFAELEADPKLRQYFEQGAQVAILTPTELGQWQRFYDQLLADGILERVGKKSLDFSGLERTKPKQAERLESSLNELLARNAHDLTDQGVTSTERAYGLDLAFLGTDGQSLPLPHLCHLRQAEVQGDVLVKTVLPGSHPVPGFVIRQPWESERETCQRATDLTAHFRRQLPGHPEVVVPVVSDGQLSLWTKLGLTRELATAASGASVDVEDVIRFLFLGENNISPGELARLGYSLPGGGGEFNKIDILFTHRDEHGTRREAVINNLVGEDLSKLKRGKGFALVPVANVAGIVIMPDNWTVEQMKAYTASHQFYLNYHLYGPKVHLLYLNTRVFDAWKQRGSVFASEAEIQDFFKGEDLPEGTEPESPEAKRFQSLARMLEYGYGAGQSAKMYLDIWRPKAEIGGMKMILSEEGPHAIAYHVIDWGTSFNVIPEDMQGLTTQPGTADGLRSQFETGQLPMVPGLYYRDYILASAKHFSALMYQSERPVVSYIRSELVKRVPFEEAAGYLGEETAKRIYDIGEKDVDHWYASNSELFPPHEHNFYGVVKDRQVAEVIVTHAHIDHCGDIPYVDGQLYGRTETIAHLQAMSAKSRSWRTQYDSWSRLTDPKEGSAYSREFRKMLGIHWGSQAVRSSINATFEQHLVNHSLTGTAMTAIYRPDGGGILYTADLKLGDLTRNTVERLAGRFDRIIMETTNFDETKVSAGLAEDAVRSAMVKLIKAQSRDAVIVVAPPNHLERLNVIMDAAASTGRKVALGHSHAQVINQMRIARQQAPLDAEGFDFLLPEVGEDVALWIKPQINPQTYQKVLSERAEAKSLGLLDQERLSREGNQWIVVISPYDVMRFMFGGVHFQGLSVLHSAPFPYARQAQARLGDNQKFIRSVGGKYFKDFEIFGSGGLVKPSRNPHHLHVSGHATYEQMVDQVVAPLLNGVYKDKTLVLVHGENPLRYAEAMRKRLGNPQGLNIIASLDRYKAADPENYRGFRLELD